MNITAVVARLAEILELPNGTNGPGLGLDFFLFDAQARKDWEAFLDDLHLRGVSQVAPIPLPEPQAAPPLRSRLTCRVIT